MPSLPIGDHRPVSWANYGTHGRSRYPELWRGCVFAAAPCLGPTGNKLIDLSGYGNHGTLNNMEPATDWALYNDTTANARYYHKKQYALEFGGTDEGITVPWNRVLQPKEITVSCWAQLYGSNQEDGLMALYDGSTGSCWLLAMSSSTQRFEFYITTAGTYDADLVASQTNPATSFVWYHVVGRFRKGGKAQLWINGVLDDESTNSTSSDIWQGATTAGLEIGRWGLGYVNGFFNGGLDDFRIYDRALSPAEIALLSTRRGIAYEPAESPRRKYLFMAEQAADDPSSQSSASSASSVSSLSSSSSSVSTSSSSASSISTSSQSAAPAIATGYQQVNVTAAVKTIDAFTIPWWASHAELQAMTQDVRYTLDGLTDPTQNSGFVLEARAKPEAFNMDDFIRIKFTRGAASDAQLNVHFIPRGEP